MSTPLYRDQTVDEIRQYGYYRRVCTLCGRSISAAGLGLRTHAMMHVRQGQAAIVPEHYIAEPTATDTLGTCARCGHTEPASALVCAQCGLEF